MIQIHLGKKLEAYLGYLLKNKPGFLDSSHLRLEPSLGNVTVLHIKRIKFCTQNSEWSTWIQSFFFGDKNGHR